MSKTIIVETKGKKIKGKVAETKEVEIISAKEVNTAIVTGVDELVSILGGEVADPTKKHCSRCIKRGRVPFHDIEDFSLLKNGKRHSQCKVCRTEQAQEWCEKQKEHRKAYHREYYKRRMPRQYKAGVNALIDTYNEQPVETKIKTSEALFVGFPTVEDIQETI